MKSFVKKLFLCVAVLMASVTVFVACDNDGNNQGKQTPVYQGMQISSTSSVESASSLMNYKNHYYGDSTDRNHNAKPDRPFGENVPDVEDYVGSLEVVGASERIYYAQANQDVLITIKLTNPDSFEILSFTLNGQKYTSYMFEDGSDLENLVLKVNVGNALGIRDFTIDAIKYIDGSEIKDVLINGDKTIKAGVQTNDLPNVEIKNQEIGLTSLEFNATVRDTYSLIQKANGKTKAYLFDGVSVVAQQDLLIGENRVSFENLNPNTLYQYAIISTFDDLEGGGVELHTLSKNSFYTAAINLFTTPTITQTTINWDYSWHQLMQNKVIVSQELYLDGSKIYDLDTDSRQLSQLLSGRDYSIKTTYKNLENQNETIYLHFTTLSKEMPNVSIISQNITQSSIDFCLNIVDADRVGTLEKLELMHDQDEPVELDITQIQITNLLSNNQYVIRATYNYDLNDGNGQQQLIEELAFTTLSKAAPTVEILNFDSTQSTISCILETNDQDDILNINKVEMLKDNISVMEHAVAENLQFNGLSSNTLYSVVVSYSYDLGDGEGVINSTCKKDYSTLGEDITVSSLSVLNSKNPKVGEEVNVRINFENPSNIKIESFILNGQPAEVVGGDRYTSAVVKFTPNTQGGQFNVELTKIKYVLNGIMLTQDISISYSQNILILGLLNVNSAYLDNPYNYVVKGGENTILFNIDNPTNYDISQVDYKIGSNSYTATENEIEVDGNTLKVSRTFYIGSGLEELTLSSITYGIEGSEYSTQQYSEVKTQVYFLSDESVNEVASLEDLKDGYINKLVADVDMSDYRGEGFQFSGIFDGNGYSIKNYSSVTNGIEGVLYAGLFTNLSGIVKNLSVENIYIDATTSVSSSVGGLTASVGGATIDPFTNQNYTTYALILENCRITGDIYVTNTSSNSNHFNNVGGFVGEKSNSSYSNFLIINNCYSDVNINIKSNFALVNAGGLIGKYATSDITNCFAVGNIKVDTTSSDLTIGGLVGNSYGGAINGCYSNVNINISSSGYKHIGQLFGGLYDTEYKNCYSSSSQEIVGYNPNNIAEIKDNAEIWQYCKQNWDSTIWNLYTDKNPTLKIFDFQQ